MASFYLNHFMQSGYMILFSSLLLVMPTNSSAADNNNLLNSMPSKCISLKQGLICYQSVQMHWQTEKIGDYCIVRRDTGLPQKCWLQQSQGDLRFEFANTQSKVYALRKRGNNTDLASVQIEVKWVYKRQHSQRFKWRVF